MTLGTINFLQKLYTKYPVSSNVVLYGFLYSAGDVSQQTITKKKPKLDLQQTGRFALIGAGVFGPFYLYWYKYLDKILPGRASKTVIQKILADQTFAGIGGIFIFYTGTSILEGKENIFADAMHKGPKTFMTGCMFWPTAQLINFALVKPQYRALYTGCAAFVWTNILCFYKSCPDNNALSPAD